MPEMNQFVRRCVSVVWNRQCLIFLFFLGLSTAFWFFQTLNETYEEEIDIPFEVINVPSNVVVTTDLPPALRVSVRDRGVQLLSYLYGKKPGKVMIDFAGYSNPSGYVNVSSAELLKLIGGKFEQSTQVTSLQPENVDFYYNYGQCKRVPVVMQGQVSAARLYSISREELKPDSVTVYAAQELLDTITAAYTENVVLRDIADTTRLDVKFRPVKGAKFTPGKATLDVCVDRLVEKSVMVSVQQINFPATKQLRTFPAKVRVTFQVGMGLYRKITDKNFVLVVNYEDLLRNNNNTCHLSLKTMPAGVSHVRITPQEVEYVIEEIPENETDS